jgi:hypothetical protein
MQEADCQEPASESTCISLYVTAQGKIPGAQNFRSPDFARIQNRKKIKYVTNGVGKFGALGLIEMFILWGPS